MISIDDARHIINSPNYHNTRLPIIKEDSIVNRYEAFDNYENFTVKRIQLPDNIIKRTRRFKKIKEMNKIEKMKQYDRDEMERKEKLVRIKQEKFINRNVILTKDVNFHRVGKKGNDSPHPLKHIAQHVKRKSDKKIEKVFKE